MYFSKHPYPREDNSCIDVQTGYLCLERRDGRAMRSLGNKLFTGVCMQMKVERLGLVQIAMQMKSIIISVGGRNWIF